MFDESTFIERCLSGNALLDDIDDFVDAWHDDVGGQDQTLSEFLGMTELEYEMWVERPSSLRLILFMRKNGVAHDSPEQIHLATADRRLAARGASPDEVADVVDWLRATKRIP